MDAETREIEVPLEAIVEMAPFPSAIVDRERRVLESNTSWQASIVHESLDTIVAPTDADQLTHMMERASREGDSGAPFDLGYNLSAGTSMIGRTAIKRFHDDAYIATIVDITDLKEAALTDPLTGLRNKGAFCEDLSRAIGTYSRHSREEGDSAVPPALLYFDIDRFRDFNNTYGHDVGDAVLKEVTQRVQGAIRSSVDRLYRVGGEEFAIIAPKTSIQGMGLLGEKIRNAVAAQPFQIDDHRTAAVSISVGAAQYVEGLSEDNWVKRADESLYHAKGKYMEDPTKGRNQVWFYDPTAGTQELGPDQMNPSAIVQYIPMKEMGRAATARSR